MTLAVVITNASKTERTALLERAVYFVNKCSRFFIGAMSKKLNPNMWMKWLNFDQ
jgi:hypothetical protein